MKDFLSPLGIILKSETLKIRIEKFLVGNLNEIWKRFFSKNKVKDFDTPQGVILEAEIKRWVTKFF